MAERLLPPNATPAEFALEQAVARRLEIPVEIRRLWRPREIGAELLPYLAWGLSVDEWQLGWTEAQRRGVADASIAVHRVKGTRGAVRRAIEALGFSGIEIEEGGAGFTAYGGLPAPDTSAYPADQRPFLFRVLLRPEDAFLLDQGTLVKLKRVILEAKNARSHLFGFIVPVPGMEDAVPFAPSEESGVQNVALAFEEHAPLGLLYDGTIAYGGTARFNGIGAWAVNADSFELYSGGKYDELDAVSAPVEATGAAIATGVSETASAGQETLGGIWTQIQRYGGVRTFDGTFSFSGEIARAI